MTRLLSVLMGLLLTATVALQECPDCTDPSRPWMRGNIEKSCGTVQQVDRLRRERPGAIILTCACKHMCDPQGDRSEETDGRSWDPRCEARCNPKSCACPHPCD